MKNCKKNPKHKQFIPIKQMMAHPLIRSLRQEEREWLSEAVDLTVRLRVNHTSLGRPDNDEFSDYRGSNNLRVGTGFITLVRSEIDKPCSCDMCDETAVRKHWVFQIQTAQHVVYNTEEAKETKVDLFYDDEKSQPDGKVVSLWGTRVIESITDSDYCLMECVTHDERIGERVESLYCRWAVRGLYNRDVLINLEKRDQSDKLRKIFTRGDQRYVLIISHPHGQPKMMTVGKLRDGVDIRDDYKYIEYHTATCPGSSGARIVGLYRDGIGVRLRHKILWWSENCDPVHIGSHGKPSSVFKHQVNHANTTYLPRLDGTSPTPKLKLRRRGKKLLFSLIYE